MAVSYASIYTLDGNELTVGLQTSRVSSEAVQTARRMAANRGEAVHLIDDDGEWIVNPDGSCEEYSENGYVIYPDGIGMIDLDAARAKAQELADRDGGARRIEDCGTERVVARIEGR